jgi:hypothetical protein
VLLPIVSFDLIPAEEPLEYIFGFSDVEDGSISVTYEDLGYESRLSVNNMGSLFITNVLLPPFYATVLFLMMKILGRKFARKIKQMFQKKFEKLFWNSII